MIAMAKEDVLARVDADIRRGHVHPAMQRLASLAAAHPDDLEIRARRAALNRQIGNLVEAGRWGFVTEDVQPSEIAAFERAFPGAQIRLHSLKLRANPARILGPLARQRLAQLVEQAERERSAPVVWDEDGPRLWRSESWRDGIPCLIAWLVGLAFVGLAVVGLITVVKLVF
jgi:hypothetical protein